MVIWMRILVYMCFIYLWIGMPSVWSVPPSPAGGNYLALDGKDDYAILDFARFGALFKEEKTRELTVEAWIYPTLPPEKDVSATILQQQIHISLISYDNDNPWDRQIRDECEWDKDDYLLIEYRQKLWGPSNHKDPDGASFGIYLHFTQNMKLIQMLR